MGFDAWLDNRDAGGLAITTNHGDVERQLADVGLEDHVLDAGGLARRLRVCRLPDAPLRRELSFRRNIELASSDDTPIWICVTTEDGYQAWSSPIYLIR
jgi:hypothetical protein